jgi:hypothetical protein
VCPRFHLAKCVALTSVFSLGFRKTSMHSVGPRFINQRRVVLKTSFPTSTTVNVIHGALQPVSIPPSDTFQSTLAVSAWSPPIDRSAGHLVIQGHNPNQNPQLNLRASAVTRTVGGMATHWTCACRMSSSLNLGCSNYHHHFSCPAPGRASAQPN